MSVTSLAPEASASANFATCAKTPLNAVYQLFHSLIDHFGYCNAAYSIALIFTPFAAELGGEECTDFRKSHLAG